MADKTCCSCLIWWYGACKKCHAFVGRCFESWGRFVYRRPMLVIILSVVTSLILMAGFMKFSVYGQAERLFYPQNSQVFQDLERVQSSFDYYVQNEEFIIIGPAFTNILTKITFARAFQIHQVILNIRGYDQLCVSTPKDTCLTINPFDGIFPKGNFDNVSRQLFSTFMDNTLVMGNGLGPRRNFPRLFGNFEVDHMTRTSLRSNVLRVIYPVKFAHTRSKYEENSAWEKKMIDFLEKQKPELAKDGLTLAYNTVRGLDDSISKNTKDNFSLISVAIGSMILFCALGMLNFRAKIRSHVLISLAGIGTVMFGIGAGFGLGLFVGQPYVGFIGVLPFLVLGIGIDDMFIIIHHLDHGDKSASGPERLGTALRQAGFSILMTTVTDLVAFIIGTVSLFPAVRIFCIFAFLSILFTFLMVLSLFVALLSLDMKRIESNRWDCVPCVQGKDPEDNMLTTAEEKGESYSVKCMKKFGVFLVNKTVKVIVVVFAAVIFALGIYGSVHTSLDFDYKISGSSGSSYVNWIQTLEGNFPFGTFQLDVVLDAPGINYTDPKIQFEFQKLGMVANKVPQLDTNKTINWMNAFTRWAHLQNVSTKGADFYTNLPTFLEQFKDFRTDLVMDGPHKISACRMHFFTKNKANWAFRKDALVNLREHLDKMDVPFYPVSFSFIYLSHLIVIIKATLTNLAICCVVILFLTLPFVIQPTVSLLLLFTFLCFIVELLGAMCLWGLSLNSVTMIVLIMAVGFAVDYSCHVVHGYLVSKEATPDLRMVDAISNIGVSVMKGALSTLIGVLVLAISDSKLFRLFFKMMFSIIMLGLIHGMIILPVLLTLLVKTKPFEVFDNETMVIDRNGSGRESQKKLLKHPTENGSELNNEENNITTL